MPLQHGGGGRGILQFFLIIFDRLCICKLFQNTNVGDERYTFLCLTMKKMVWHFFFHAWGKIISPSMFPPPTPSHEIAAHALHSRTNFKLNCRAPCMRFNYFNSSVHCLSSSLGMFFFVCYGNKVCVLHLYTSQHSKFVNQITKNIIQQLKYISIFA